MKITFLGTGTSVGIPVIACDCAVCASSNPKNKRRRASLYVEAEGVAILIDTPPDFREQALAFRIRRVDAVLVTHSHADHVFGMDDIRRYNTVQGCAIPVYASPGVCRDLERIFDYVHNGSLPAGTFRPDVSFVPVSGVFPVGAIRVEPLPVEHGVAETRGFRLDAGGRTIAYVPDCKRMADEVIERVRGVDVMILDALRLRPHPTHVTLEESIALLQRIGAGRSFITHVCHDLEHDETQRRLPAGMAVAWDGLALEW